MVVRGATSFFDDLGHGTNSDAEWRALLCAVQVARSQDFTDIELVGDAIEVVEQARKVLRDGNADHPYAAAFLTSAAQISTLHVRWIKRQQNLAGIALAARHPR